MLLLWLSTWPLGLLQTAVWDLPQQPSFTASHLWTLLAALALVAGSTARAREAWSERPRQRDPLAGAVICWIGLALFVYVWLVLGGIAPQPGWLMSDRLSRFAYLVVPLLFRGTILGMSRALAPRVLRRLLHLNLLVFVAGAFAFRRHPYRYIDGQFFGADPTWEALAEGLLLAVATAILYGYGLHRSPGRTDRPPGLGARRTLILAALCCLPVLGGAWLSPVPAGESLAPTDLRTDIVDPLERSVWLGADWLLRDQNADGSYRYLYSLADDVYLNDENIIRQAGTAYVAAYLCGYTGDADHCGSASRSLGFVTAQLQSDDTGTYILYDGHAALGATALTLVAIAHYQLATGSREYSGQMTEMADHMLTLQNEDGSFNGFHKFMWFFRRDRHVSVYAGEAMYALAMAHRLTGRPEYRAAYDRADPWYLDYWENTHDTNLYAWAAKAGYHMYLATGEAGYARLTWQLSDWIVDRQNLRTDQPGYGSFVGGISINSGTYTEGVGDALYLAEALGDEERVERYRQAIALSARSAARLQVDRALAESGPRPLRSFGCFRSIPQDLVLRIDYAQHAMAAILRHLKWEKGLYDTEPDGMALTSSQR